MFQIILIQLQSLPYLLGIQSSVNGKCANGWLEAHKTKCIMIHRYYLNFFEGYSLCHSIYKSSLLTIKYKEDQFYYNSFLFHEHSIKREVLLGLRRINDNQFEWVDGSPVNYSNWAASEPSDLTTYCVVMNNLSSNFGRWYDRGCREPYAIVCEKNMRNVELADGDDEDGDDKSAILDHLSGHKTMLIVVLIMMFILIVSVIVGGIGLYMKKRLRKPFDSSLYYIKSNDDPFRMDE